MTRVSVKDARGSLKKLLDLAAGGEEVAILRRGREIARLVPPRRGKFPLLASLRQLRRSLKLKGAPLRATVIETRKDQRY